jgi:anti-sigma B factor antagonist
MGGAGTSARDIDRGGNAGGEFSVAEERPDPQTVVIAIHGDADLTAASELRDRLGEAIAGGPSVLVLDLSDATFLDSMALGVFLSGMRSQRARGGRFRVVAPRDDIRRIFELTLLDRVFDLDRSRQDALAAAGASPAAARGD